MEPSPGSEVKIAQHEARVITWNINGLRKVAASHGGLKGLLDQFGADIGKSIVLYLDSWCVMCYACCYHTFVFYTACRILCHAR